MYVNVNSLCIIQNSKTRKTYRLDAQNSQFKTIKL